MVKQTSHVESGLSTGICPGLDAPPLDSRAVRCAGRATHEATVKRGRDYDRPAKPRAALAAAAGQFFRAKRALNLRRTGLSCDGHGLTANPHTEAAVDSANE